MATNGKKRTKKVRATTIASPGVVRVVRNKGGYEVRVYNSYAAAVAGGMPPKSAKACFKKAGDCGGECAGAYEWEKGEKYPSWVWCVDENCVTDRCECHLFEIWKDKDGEHDEDRGYPGKGWKYRMKPDRFYECRCRVKPI